MEQGLIKKTIFLKKFQILKNNKLKIYIKMKIEKIILMKLKFIRMLDNLIKNNLLFKIKS